MSAPLQAPHAVHFSYERSVGGATERFLRGLVNGEVIGSRAGDGRVTVPPVDHDPETGAASDGFVGVADAGVVRSWTWVRAPRPDHPLDHPFAFALIQLHGADTALLHVVDAGTESLMATGMRVHADWHARRTGSVHDIRAFVSDGVARTAPAAPSSTGADPDPSDPITVASDVRLEYTFEPGHVLSDFYRALADGRIGGGMCPSCTQVYVPPRSRCPACGTSPMAPVVLGGTGTVESFAVVHLPVHGMDLELPFVWAWIRLDGADVAFAHLLGDIAPDAVHVGQRVEAVWEPEADRPMSWEAIRHFQQVTP